MHLFLQFGNIIPGILLVQLTVHVFSTLRLLNGDLLKGTGVFADILETLQFVASPSKDSLSKTENVIPNLHVFFSVEHKGIFNYLLTVTAHLITHADRIIFVPFQLCPLNFII